MMFDDETVLRVAKRLQFENACAYGGSSWKELGDEQQRGWIEDARSVLMGHWVIPSERGSQ